MIAYAFALGIEIALKRSILTIMLLPALLWIGAAISLLPEESRLRETLFRIWAVTSIPIAILTLLNPWFASLIIGALLACAGMVARLASRTQFKNTIALIAVVALFITLSTGLLLIPLNWLPRVWVVALLGLDLVFLGLLITAWDAFDEGESIRAPLLRSFVSAFYYAGLLAIIAGFFSDNLLLLTIVIAFGILTQTFSDPIEALLD
ncbi:MAG TPA: hypothetical protein VJ180_04030, partial [Pyrinomonadaceae bacterium]|nr:hypothetical protein [Pyrinomonadaceae bacterium]